MFYVPNIRSYILYSNLLCLVMAVFTKEMLSAGESSMRALMKQIMASLPGVLAMLCPALPRSVTVYPPTATLVERVGTEELI